MRVVKLGGSLADWSDLPACLASLAELSCVIVPGGGPFADQVRDTQRRWRFDDATAHDMAILAMAQFGRMLAGLDKRLHRARTIPTLQAHIADRLTTVWLPDPDDGDLKAIPPSWEVTSDSLAAWLACRLGATDLILLKSAPLPDGEADFGRLAADGIVDPAFAQSISDAAYATWLCQREHHQCLQGTLSESPGLARIGLPHHS